MDVRVARLARRIGLGSLTRVGAVWVAGLIAIGSGSGSGHAQEARLRLDPAPSPAGWEAALLSRTRAEPGQSHAVAVLEGAGAVAALQEAIDLLPRQPFGEPTWRLDTIRRDRLANSFLLSESEIRALGEAAAPLLQSLRSGRVSHLYRVEVDPGVLARAETLEPLRAAGLRAFYPSEPGASWASYEVTLAAYTPAGDRTATRAPVPAPDAARARFEQRLRSLLQPRPLSGAEEERFQELLPEFYAHFRDLSANPEIRELRVDYRRQRWQTSEDRRNLLIIARYSVRTSEELEALERYMAARPAVTRGRSQPAPPGQLVIVATERRAGALRDRLETLLPGLDRLRVGR